MARTGAKAAPPALLGRRLDFELNEEIIGCSRYLVGSRLKAEVSSGSSNLGFRLVRSH